MTIMGAISHLDAVKPNGYRQTEKIKWLSTLDGIVKEEVIDTHEGGESITFNGYDDTTPITQELLIPHPYDDIYIKWLEAQIDYANGEYNKYNNSMNMYNTSYTAFVRYYNRMHMPLQKGKFGKGGSSSGSAVGKPGKDGYTPKKGIDYWTSADKKEIVQEVIANMPGGGGGSITVDQEYKPQSANAQSGKAVEAAIEASIGDISEALDTIHEYAQSLIGGESE